MKKIEEALKLNDIEEIDSNLEQQQIFEITENE